MDTSAINPYVIPGTKITKIAMDRAAANVWGIPVERLYEKTRDREIVEPRQVVMYYRRNALREEPGKISRESGFNHSTVNHSCKTVASLLETSKEFRAKYHDFLIELNR